MEYIMYMETTTKTHIPNYTPEQLKETIISTGINILEDTTQVINNELVLIGRADKGDMVNVRKDISELVDGLNSSMEWIVLDHQPADYKLCEQNGADIFRTYSCRTDMADWIFK